MLKVVVIGGVAGGMSAAAKLKRNLKDQVQIVVYEKGHAVSYAACGIPYFVSDWIKEPGSLMERSPAEFAKSGIDVRLGHNVTGVDTKAKTVTGANLETGEMFVAEYDKLIVASGATPRLIPPFDTARKNLMVVRDVDDGIRIKKLMADRNVKNVVVVGAGFIGLEMVEAAVEQGKNTVVVEFVERILSVMDPEMTDLLTEELKKNNVSVRTDSKVVELECDGERIVAAVVESQGRRETIPADLVINSVGIVPNTGFIDVQKSVNGAIIVNERMETSAPDVYAAGDCSVMTSFLTCEHQYAPLGTNANKQGRMIAEILAGKPAPTFKLIGSSAVKVFGLDAAKVGMAEVEAQKRNLDYKTNMITGNSYASYYSPERLTLKLVYHAKTRKILGVQAVGQGVVVARANYFAIAISAGMTVEDFGYLDLCYAPPYSGVWDATHVLAHTAK